MRTAAAIAVCLSVCFSVCDFGQARASPTGEYSLRSAVFRVFPLLQNSTAGGIITERPTETDLPPTPNKIENICAVLFFLPNSGSLSAEAQSVLFSLSDELKKLPKSTLLVTGFAPLDGIPESLAGDRANSVTAALVKNGIRSSRIVSRTVLDFPGISPKFCKGTSNNSPFNRAQVEVAK